MRICRKFNKYSRRLGMKKLPIGIQTFKKIIRDNYLYIDKTREIVNLINNGEAFFLSRPRRFGKSLLVSTLKEIFSGNKDLFKGLYIYDKIQWETHPVIHLDFSVLDYETGDQLKKSLLSALDTINKTNDLAIDRESLKVYFEKILKALAEKYQINAVVLIDEYDKPIIDVFSNLEKARENREILKNFFSVLKVADPFLRFVFLTGVSKFSKVSIFSGLNNLNDITLSGDFSTILGISEEELTTYFKDRITELSRKENISITELIQQIRHWYNGYSWDGINRLYNPASLLSLFFNKRFGNYWFATGTPGFLIETVKNNNYEITEIEKTEVGENVFDSYDIDHIDVTALLFQTGYLTVKKIEKYGQKLLYILSYPNNEVKNSFLNYLLSEFTETPVSKMTPLHIRLVQALANKDMDKFSRILTSIFARIPYNLHIKEEHYYHSLFYMVLTLMGVEINLEVLSDKGRVDGILKLDKSIYFIEFKMDYPQKAINQIKERKYFEPYLNSDKEIFLLGAGGFKDKNIKCILEALEK